MVFSIAALIVPAIVGYIMAMLMDAGGNHSDPLPANWQTIVEETMEAEGIEG